MIFNNRFFRSAGFLLIASGVFTAALLYACSLTLNNQKQHFETEARNTATIVRSAMNVVDGVATSLRALQGSRADTSQSDSYAKTVISNYSFVSGFGRFEKITNDQAAGFTAQENTTTSTTAEGELSSPFSIWWIDDQGNRVTTGLNTRLGATHDAANRYPVTLFKNQASFRQEKTSDNTNEASIDLIGYDFGSMESVRTALFKAIDSGNTALVKAPDFWPKDNAVLAIRSSYQGNDLPEVFKDRRYLMNGGHWLEIDVNGLIALDDSLDTMGLKLSTVENVSEFSLSDTASEVLYYRPAEASGYIFSKWFSKNEWLNTFSVGDQIITITLTRERGLTISSLLSSIVGTVLFLTLLSTIVFLNNIRRKAQRKQKLQSEHLYQEQHRAAVTLSSIGDAVLTVDVQNSVQYNNSAAAKLLNVDEETIIGRPVSSVIRLLDQNSNQLAAPKITNDNYTSENISSDQKLVRLDGTSMAVNLTVSPLLGIDGDRSGSVIVLRDVSAEKELTEQLEHQVNHDSLTGLANRYQFEKSLEQLFEVTSAGTQHALCIIDLDRFKQINDTCGHAAGDELLKQLATALQGKIRAEDLLARLGGDEFGIIIYNCLQDDANAIAHRVHRFFKTFHFEYDNRVFPVRSSIGLVHFRPGNFKLATVVSAADAACYIAKKNGRNAVHIHSVEDFQDADLVNEELWMPRIQEALDEDKFALYVQPIVESGSKNARPVRHHELLIRMVGADQSLTYPVEFLKPAERYELMTQIDQWVIKAALDTISRVPGSMRQDLFSINLSAASVKDETLINFIKHTLHSSKVNASQLCFEIDEDVVLNNLESANTLLRQLRKIGCSVALDDFGAGVSSLSALKELPVNYLKIDGQFTSNIANSAVDENMVRSIHRFAKSMGMATIAEKVESHAAMTMLESIGIDYIQGFVIAEPVPFDLYLQPDQIAA